MRIGRDKLDKLVGYIERWLTSSPARNIGMLQRLSGVAGQTIRRILQRENEPEFETAMCLLNIVASPEEALEVLGSSQAFSNLIRKIESFQGKKSPDADVIASQLFNRERFWAFTVAMAVGVTQEIMEKLCGSYGLFELEKMVEEKILYEKIPGRFYPNISQNGFVIENKDVYSRANGYIAEFAMQKSEAQRLFSVFNVTNEARKVIKEKFFETYRECIEIAEKSPGDIVIATSVVNTTVLGE